MWGTANRQKRRFELLLKYMDFSGGRAKQVWKKVQDHLSDCDLITDDYLDQIAGGILVDIPTDKKNTRG